MVKHILAAVGLAVCIAHFPCDAHAEIIASAPLSSSGIATEESSIGDLVADAVKEAAHTSIALMPAGSFREVNIPKGKTDTESVLRCLQYPDDRVVVLELTGIQLQHALERSVSIYPQKTLGFLQVSGVEMSFKQSGPKGERVLSIVIGKEKLVNDRKYRVATTLPLAEGSYGYFTVWNSTNIGKTKDITVSRAVSDYLSTKNLLDYSDQHRILSK